MKLTAEDIMTFPNHGQMYPGQPLPYREPPPQIPKRHTVWIALVLFGTMALVLIGLVVGFWRAGDAPLPVIESPDLQPPQLPVPR
jgi:hypothetical protein